ncbi:hypothetical protein MG293_013379 [Ovis ammon polii]|uniref:Uncharacterized protein n=1 Tax=Ovis ammon polii TaxID=230172 RepID=A0AAD4U0C0_OVIAM|nr:hypothetical protein MG293_013379 [Ovis ammon polii]
MGSAIKKIFGFGSKKGVSPFGSSINLVRDSGHGINFQPRYHIRDKDLRKIHKAAIVGNVAKVQHVLFGKNGLNDRDKMKRTALHLACANGHSVVVTLLLERKCLLNLCDNENRTVLMKALECQEEECATLLLEHGADPNVTDISGNTALLYAVFCQNISLAAKLLSCNANIEARNKVKTLQEDPHKAELEKYKQLYLVELEVRKSLEGKLDRTALHLACANGHSVVVTLLLERKCLLNLCDNENRTVLMKALECQEEECATLLLEHGADPNVMDISGNTTLLYAVFCQNISLAAKLLSCDANIEARNKAQRPSPHLLLNRPGLSGDQVRQKFEQIVYSFHTSPFPINPLSHSFADGCWPCYQLRVRRTGSD